ncbi:MAG: hypothetical protein HZA00_06160 [Nitrospinae bacterium]|nr:hypothetical protein [Nitrospinota bacterium]
MKLKYFICGFLAFVVFILLQSYKEVCGMENISGREQVIDVVNGVVISVDRRDWKTCRSYFIDEPFIDYSSLNGQAGSKVKADKLVKGWSDFYIEIKIYAAFYHKP